jgi:hypothetical protein
MLAILVCSASPVHASLGDSTGNSLASSTLNFEGPILSGIYKTAQDTTVIPRAMAKGYDIQENANMQAYELPKSMPVALRIEGDTVYLIPMVAPQERGKMPDTYIFSTQDLAQTGLKFQTEGDENTLYEEFSYYAEALVAGRCKALVQAHFGVRWPGMCASQITGAALAATGFFPSSCAAAHLKLWGGGKGHSCGHVAWRSGSSWSSGDFYGDPGSGFYSKGCYARRGGFNTGRVARGTRTSAPSVMSGSVFGNWFAPQQQAQPRYKAKARSYRRR